MTVREAVSRLRKIMREVNADSRFTSRLAYSILLSISKLLIKRDSERLKIMTQSNLFRKLRCVEVIKAPAIDPCCGVKSTCIVWRTKNKLPKIYTDTTGPLIKSVYTIDGLQTLLQIQPENYLSLSKNPWNKKKNSKYYFYSDGYLYFPNGGFKMVEVEAYWEENIDSYSTCNSKESGNCVSFLDSDFMIPTYLETPMFQLAEQEVRGTYSSLPEKSNEIDKNDSIKQ